MLQTLVEIVAKCQTLKTVGQGHPSQPLVETVAKCQCLKGVGQIHLFQALVETSAKCQSLKITWQIHMFQALVETLVKYQAFKALGELVLQMMYCFDTFHLRDPLQCKLFLRHRCSCDVTPWSIHIGWNISAGEGRSLAHNALITQCLVEHHARIKVMQDDISPFLWWKLLRDRQVYFPTQNGTTERHHASFAIDAQHMKIN